MAESNLSHDLGAVGYWRATEDSELTVCIRPTRLFKMTLHPLTQVVAMPRNRLQRPANRVGAPGDSIPISLLPASI